MPVINFGKEQVQVPASVTGKDLRKLIPGIPPNKDIYRMRDGKNEIIPEGREVPVADGDQIEALSRYPMGK